MSEQSQLLIAELLIKKFGQEKVAGLLTGEFTVEKDRKESRASGTFSRTYREGDPLMDHDYSIPGHGLRQLPPALFLEALDDAHNEMSYSNWHGDKFERISEMVIRYCEMKNIPIDITFRNDGETE